MNPYLLNKYSIPVPRYTSYPPANFFTEAFTAQSYKEAIIRSNTRQPSHISIYIHIPFCLRLCYYCGCNATLLKDKTIIKPYIEAIKKEMRMVFPLVSKERKIAQIHYGGGTPTSLQQSVLKELNEQIFSEFDCIENPEIAIECHPGYMNEAYWQALPDMGFNRVSIGIQDFNTQVLAASHRKSSNLPMEDIVSWLRKKNVSVNLDFIYGLPLQTTATFSQSIREAIRIRPDRIVTFSYAHVPWVNPLQQKLEKAGLPTVSQKNELFATASGLLKESGYKSIGLDHFVLPDDELHKAFQEKKLHRNFQGYCTRRTTGQVYAFGVTGISQLADSYSQNIKDIPTYIDVINKNDLATKKGYLLNKEEQTTREVISALMCNYAIHWGELAKSLHLSVEEIRQTINYDENALSAFAKDNIISYDNDHIQMQPEATPFVRNVAASLDKLMIRSDKKFSRTI